jgi:hypothetical protein
MSGGATRGGALAVVTPGSRLVGVVAREGSAGSPQRLVALDEAELEERRVPTGISALVARAASLPAPVHSSDWFFGIVRLCVFENGARRAMDGLTPSASESRRMQQKSALAVSTRPFSDLLKRHSSGGSASGQARVTTSAPVEITLDAPAKVISFRDHGAGLSGPALIRRIIDLPRSLQDLLDKRLAALERRELGADLLPGSDLISWLAVADTVVVQSAEQGAAQTVCVFRSDFPGTMYYGPDTLSPHLGSGTRITLHMKPSCESLCDPNFVAQLVELARQDVAAAADKARPAAALILTQSVTADVSSVHGRPKVGWPQFLGFLCFLTALATAYCLWNLRSSSTPDTDSSALCNTPIFEFVWINFFSCCVFTCYTAANACFRMSSSPGLRAISRSWESSCARNPRLRSMYVHFWALVVLLAHCWIGIGAFWILKADGMCLESPGNWLYGAAIGQVTAFFTFLSLLSWARVLAIFRKDDEVIASRQMAFTAALNHNRLPVAPATSLTDLHLQHEWNKMNSKAPVNFSKSFVPLRK